MCGAADALHWSPNGGVEVAAVSTRRFEGGTATAVTFCSRREESDEACKGGASGGVHGRSILGLSGAAASGGGRAAPEEARDRRSGGGGIDCVYMTTSSCGADCGKLDGDTAACVDSGGEGVGSRFNARGNGDRRRGTAFGRQSRASD
jgi:hypothetical protein